MPDDINQRIAARARQLRAERGLTLEVLAERCGVSRSMISLIERGESSPTAVVLEKLAAGLGTTLAALSDAPAAAAEPLARHAAQPVWRDPGSGYVRRNVSPGGFPSPVRIVEVEFPPGARVAYENGVRAIVPQQQVWVLQGMIEITLGDQRYDLREGDCLAFALDRPTAYHNPTTNPARYAVVIVSPANTR
jgi:transcriptional regulator with XRE-family HTH domain